MPDSPKTSLRRWADYEEDEPLPQYVFGVKMWEDAGWTKVKTSKRFKKRN